MSLTNGAYLSSSTPTFFLTCVTEAIWAASPSTTRGQATQLSSDAKGERLAYASNKSIFLRSIDDPTVSKQYTEHKAQTTVARFSPSGYYVWDCVGEGGTRGDFPIISGRINDIAWDGEEQYGRFITWDIRGHTRPRPFRAAAGGDDRAITTIRDNHSNYIYAVAFSPDGSHFIWLYDGTTGVVEKQIGEGEHTGSIFGVSWSSDSRKFVTASGDRTVKLWDVETSEAIQTWKFEDEGKADIHHQQVGVVKPSGRSDGLIISLSLSGDLNYLVEGTPKPRQVIQGHQKNITALTSFKSAEGTETLWTGSFEGRVRSWDTASGTAEPIDGENPTAYISGLTSTSEGKGRIYSVGWDDTLRIADAGAKTYTEISTRLSSQPRAVTATEGTVLVAHAQGIDIIQDGQKTGSAKLPAEATAVAIHGTTAAAGAVDSTVQIGTVKDSTFTSEIEFKASQNGITVLAFSPDGSLLAVGDARGKILLYNSKDGKLVTDRWASHTARITSIAWNPEGTHAVSGSLDAHIFVWSVAHPGEHLQAAHAHKEGVNGVAWIDGGNKLASAGADASVKIWKLRQVTFILPQTGQRLKGLLNLGNRDVAEDGSDDERHPLLAGSSDMESAHHPSDMMATMRDKVQGSWNEVYAFATSELGIGVFKFGLAYLLGSLATYIPAISDLLGHQDGKHLVATITVYFHPARSRGSMFKALICAILAFLYASFVSVTSMCVSMFFENLDLLVIGHIIVLVVFCAGGFGFIGWVKQRFNDPLVNVACSLASLSTITVLTREGAVQKGDLSFAKISQTVKMLVMGVCSTMAVSFLIFPISARKKLRSNLTTMTNTLAIMLAGVTESFLTGSDENLRASGFADASARNRKAYGVLDNLVKEAKLEHYVAGTEREYRLEKRLVRCIQDINQNMGGLQSAASLQFQLLKQSQLHVSTPHGSNSMARRPSTTGPMDHFSAYGDTASLASEYELETEPGETAIPVQTDDNNQEAGSPHSEQSPHRMFEVFISHLGPSLQSFAFTLKEILEEIPFGPGPKYQVSFNSRFKTSLNRALELYREAREKALESVYREKDFAKIVSPAVEADMEEVSASCGHFSFTLMEFGEQLKDLLEILDDLKLECEERPQGHSWNWLKFWRSFKSSAPNFNYFDYGESPNPNPNATSNIPSIIRKTYYSLETGYSDGTRHRNRLPYRIWKSLSFFRRDETKFALKVGVGAALYALPSFHYATRPIFTYWRGEWGLLSYMLVCSMTIGASNTTGYARFFGTCLGACCSIAAWYATAGNVYGLAFFGWLMATWTAYIILVKGQGPMGRFIMLTYNLSVLYAYSLTANDNDNDDDEGGTHPIITEIALHRVVAVLSGCIWGIIVTRMIWPISARAKLKEGLSLLWLQMSLIWKRDPLSTMVDGKPAIAYLSSREKLQIERFVSHLESLQNAAKSEFELKGAFPEEAYRNMIQRTRSMLNAFYAMNLEILKNLTASEGEICLLQYTAQERGQLSSRISHLLSVLASSMKLEYPLNNSLPNIQHARDRLLARIFHFRQESERSSLTTDGDYALLYAYGKICPHAHLLPSLMQVVLVTGQLGTDRASLTMQIDPAALSRTDSTSAGVSASKTVASSGSLTQKSTKPLISVPRLDLEPAYTDLKAAIGDNWAEYKQSTALFLLGHLNQDEFSSRADHIVCADPKTEHLHNNFICALIGNLSRDLPDHGVASWVSANDKPTVVSKPVSSDLAEQRLKTEVMQLPPRDRRRIKAITEPDPQEISRNELEEYHLAKQIKLPSQVPASAGGLNKTNWELEIRKRYAQPLASETGEFPDAESIYARMVPICYEESVASGASFPCAELMAIATETYVKEVLSSVFSRTRHNGPSGTINGMVTRKYRRQLEREELAFARGEIAKDIASGLLPAEAREASIRQPLGVRDLKLSLTLGGALLGQMPLLIDHIMSAYDEDELEAERQGYIEELQTKTEDDDGVPSADEMDIDEEWGWEGGTGVEREQLGSLLDECLALAA
ncbi:transcriptional regulator of RNA polII, SAGA, subunit-domain-containing protein [Talaromyces proteolyticus]|uniref:Transcriptional regulator of RNA polII, SAGA, subunit-domain-containing protein n=1 Tax=Talaromyces proteolyticus TaxID=1131652 RepID=A0AAD4L0C6_9EURO|nr:transcriptional regulator of RNA polII, SAGA, subunit-domain-containing protein [Talaromyces proteolyticus]KAH8704729.1 transcriptional regulator of RNA polII, SAGA, subunit-domain-containing protein [Talaromyces proteolyticus]